MLWKKRPSPPIFYREDYRQFMKTVRVWLEEAKREDGYPVNILYDYLIDALLEDLCTSEIVSPFLSEKRTRPVPPSPFPDHFTDEMGKESSACGQKETEINLKDVKLYLRPWNLTRTARNLFLVGRGGFHYQRQNHRARYYPEINLCYVYNGNHSINAGRYFQTGSIHVQVWRLDLLFPHCKTDGTAWYNSHTGQPIGPVSDFRLALVYSLAQTHWQDQCGLPI